MVDHRRKIIRQMHDEAGYTLVALLALMTVLAITLAAAAPVLKQQAQRERELEAIRRGEEVAEAIRIFHEKTQPNRLPNSIDELIEGVQVPGRTKKLQVLRASAARDPLSENGKWRLVRATATNSALCDFVASLVKYNDSNPVLPNDRFQQFVQCGASAFTGAVTSAIDDSDTGPFLGVASRSRENSVVTYYGLDKHNEWVFTPAVPKQN